MVKKTISIIYFFFIGIAISNAQNPNPNFIFILTDDQGWSDFSFSLSPEHKNPYESYFLTPNLNQLANNGITFYNGYAPSSICTPTRRAIQFGLTPARQRGTEFVSKFDKGEYLSIPEVLKKNDPNYLCAHFGKWGKHILGTEESSKIDYHPELVFGYDYSDGSTTNADGGYEPREMRFTLQQDDQDPKSTNSLTEKAIDFLELTKSRDRPFYLQLSYYSIHSAYFASSESIEKSRQLEADKIPSLIDFGVFPMTIDLDNSVGKIMEVLKSLELHENTYVFFVSDNGGAPGSITTEFRNQPLRRGKGVLYEGGIRVPFFVSGPGISNAYSEFIVSATDLFPTIVELSGGSISDINYEIDGISLLSALINGDKERKGALFWHAPYSNKDKLSAIRKGDYKLLIRWSEYYDNKEVELFNLKDDIKEAFNLESIKPKVRDSLYSELISYLTSVNAELPLNWKDFGNPQYKRGFSKGMEIFIRYHRDKSFISIKLSEMTISGTIKIHDMNGKMVFMKFISNTDEIELGTDVMRQGMFIVTMELTNNHSISKKILIN